MDRDWVAVFVPGIYKSYSSVSVDTDKKREAILWDEDEIGLYKDLKNGQKEVDRPFNLKEAP